MADIALCDQGTMATINAPELDHAYVYNALRKIELMKHVRKQPLPRRELPRREEGLTSTMCSSQDKARKPSYWDHLSYKHTLFSRIEEAEAKLSDEIDVHIKPYAALRCYAICDDMQCKLPREIREMIYDSLIVDRLVSIDEEDFKPIKELEATRPLLSNCKYLLDPAFADPATKYEVLEFWYKSCTFHFESEGFVNKLVEQDFWDLQLPVYDLVKKIAVQVWYPEVLRKTEARYYNNRAIALKELECLFALKPRTHITLILPTEKSRAIWDYTDEDIQLLVSFYSEVFPLAERLIDSGYRLSVEVDPALSFDVTKAELSDEFWVQMISKKVLEEKDNEQEQEDSEQEEEDNE
ncbi:uncharacterized protein K460DRAFT_400437 [Cucurbitaria berberidis CBS 394.84]|uniref:Uncharacterized protein n=1 Tax=Cucurbitaria berberidis CBS 394.84 TaxID=1168544 RepID=A0A9P4LCU2_9PLEO|nr:uncharacterized protein K460DRAFT_400437 [Cucurbitaria berberidis CBS 394.84]KAF1850370.1 hypothetical protein K460DRAFT_400437 [Cucurbitaria berberidis CBS 394.84]